MTEIIDRSFSPGSLIAEWMAGMTLVVEKVSGWQNAERKHLVMNTSGRRFSRLAGNAKVRGLLALAVIVLSAWLLVDVPGIESSISGQMQANHRTTSLRMDQGKTGNSGSPKR